MATYSKNCQLHTKTKRLAAKAASTIIRLKIMKRIFGIIMALAMLIAVPISAQPGPPAGGGPAGGGPSGGGNSLLGPNGIGPNLGFNNNAPAVKPVKIPVAKPVKIPTSPSPSGFGPSIPMWGKSPGMLTGGPWGVGYFGPTTPPTVNFNSGVMQVVAVGYDVQGVWETVPLIIDWDWGGVIYDITVVNAWNPWTQVWDDSVNIPAYQTTYTLRGNTYNWYVNLSTGTYYFNL